MPVPPIICPSCDISILPGTDHTTDEGCFVALKQFVKLCQDEIESSRMNSYQHPTRDELLDQLQYLTDQFEKFVIYTNSVLEKMRDARRGTLVR